MYSLNDKLIKTDGWLSYDPSYKGQPFFSCHIP